MCKYDIVISWGLPNECLFAVLAGQSHVIAIPRTRILKEDLEGKFAEGRPVSIAVCGKYFDNVADLQDLVDFPIDVHTIGDGLGTYTHSMEKLLEVYIDIDWVHLILARPNKSSPKRAENLRKGIQMLISPWKSIEDIYRCLLDGTLNYFDLIVAGRPVVKYLTKEAISNASKAGREIKVGPYTARIISGGWQNVVITTKAAARDHDIGINVRYNLKTDKTHFSFFTWRDDVDLSFVGEAPFNGGGRKGCCYGCTLDAQILIDRDSLEECILK